jgi:hypothetical protein
MKRLPCARVALVAAGALLGAALFLLADVLVLSRFIVDEDEPGIHRHGERGWYALKADLRGVPSRWGAQVYPVSTDALGFRIDPARAPTRPAEFVFLGDSYTFGVNGPWAETFVGLFEQQSGRAIINAGGGSYSPTAYLHHYRRALAAGALKAPHTVVVGIDISDVQDEAAIWRDGEVTPARRDGTYHPARSPAREIVASRFLATRRIYRFIRYGHDAPSAPTDDARPPEYVYDQGRSGFTWRAWSEIEQLSRGHVDPGDPAFFGKWGYGPLGVQGGLDRVAAKLRATAVVARAHQGSLWILIYPWPAQLRYPGAVFDWQAFNRDLCAAIACRGVIDTFPIFQAYAAVHEDWYRRLFVQGDTHFNATGNRMIADELSRILLGSSRS